MVIQHSQIDGAVRTALGPADGVAESIDMQLEMGSSRQWTNASSRRESVGPPPQPSETTDHAGRLAHFRS
jgi:hypothetical protein